jgi:putative methionine-R-sulfoxide reductase with GAF domain
LRKRFATPAATSWVGLYDVLADEIAAFAWTGDEPPANPRFACARGLERRRGGGTKAGGCERVARDARYLATPGSTRAEMIVPAGTRVAPWSAPSTWGNRADAFDDRDLEFVDACATAASELWEQ